jgi:hypothetical protein
VKILHSEVNILTDCIIVQDQDEKYINKLLVEQGNNVVHLPTD